MSGPGSESASVDRRSGLLDRLRSLGRRGQGEHALGSWLYLRILGLVHVIAFLDFGAQLEGLIGARGLLPARELLAAHAAAGHGFWDFPTLAWWGASDGELRLLAAVGAAAGLALLIGWRPRVMLAIAFVAYLSLVQVGGPFMAFQWDSLLLEATAVAFALAPAHREPLRTATGEGPSAPPVLAWAAHAFLFGRLMFASGVVKIASGDPDWASLQAMDLHYWTQPLPNPLSPYAAALPSWFHTISVVGVFVLELAFPVLLLVRGWPRRVGALGLMALQALIALTGNYGFFNLLSAAMALPLLDDAFLRRMAPRLSRRAGRAGPRRGGRLASAWAAVTILLGAVPLYGTLFGYGDLPDSVLEGSLAASRFGLANGYGLFADMTDDRIELIVEGTSDGQRWEPYELPHKPGRLDRRPSQAAPRMPRLDWSLWFAALGSPSHERVAARLRAALERAEPAVLALIADDPFGGRAPRAVRIVPYRYRFTTAAQRRASGEWWRRSPLAGVNQR